MTNKDHNDIQENGPQDIEHEKGALDRLIQVLWRSPLGVFGVGITTVSITLIMIGTIIDMLGLIENPYAALVTYTMLPALMLFGLFLIPVAIYLQRRKWHKYGIDREQIIVNLSNPKHRLALIGFIVLSVVNVAILAIIQLRGISFHRLCLLLRRDLSPGDGSGVRGLSTLSPLPGRLCRMSYRSRGRMVCQGQNFRTAPGGGGHT
jgi:TRAP-type uncharacterized transport system fused permease subunit